MKSICALGLSLCCLSGLASGVEAGPESGIDATGSRGGGITSYSEPVSYHDVRLSVDSGIVRVDPVDISRSVRAVQVPAWSEVIEVDGAGWVRLYFDDVVLARSTEHVRESYIRLTSLEDGYEQYLDAESIEEWRESSAYFNGDAVLVELMVSASASDQINRVRVVGVQASEPAPTDRSICFSIDDRALSSDPRDGRLMPIGCSAWLFGEHGSCFLSASHCTPDGGDVMQFNVPLSSSSGGYRNPPPSDQYVVDGASVQRSSNVFIGNDWAFFGTFDNSTTGMTPMDAQGASHTLTDSMPPVDGRAIRITGYGTVSSPVSGTWNGVQKTHVGPLSSISGNTVRYQTDTTGGNSGSVILDDLTNTAIGIHTNAGCGSGGGSNQGTGLFNSGLQTALSNPIGICEPRTIQAGLVFEPTHIDPSGGEVVTLVLYNLHGHSVEGSPTMFVDSGSGFVGSSMALSGVDQYEGVFGAIDCGSSVSYYFELEDEEGTVVSVPSSGVFQTVALNDLTVAFEDSFETNLDWLSFTTGGSGAWLRTIPIGHGLGDPDSDADGSSRCYVTSNSNGVDVDNGSVFLLSPVIDLSGIESPTLRMSVWMVGSEGDALTVSVTDNAGVSWVELDSFVNTGGWIDLEYSLEDHVSLNLAFRARIEARDGGADTTVEGGVDAFSIASEICDGGCAADLNGDGTLDFFDVSAFLSAFGSLDPIADFTGDGSFDFFDVSAFLDAFSDGCP